MRNPRANDDFFVGWSPRMPLRLAGFWLVMVVLLLAIAAGLSLAIGAATHDQGNGRFIGGNANLKIFTGIVETEPYPIMRVMPTDDQPARAIALAGLAKFGVQQQAAGLQGQIADAKGFFVRRGALDMLVVRGGFNNSQLTATQADLTESQRAFTPAPAVPLGRWRLAGEICDSKCYAGVMRPGGGITHRACANLCLDGGLAPVFASTGAVDGTSFLWLANADGGPLPEAYLDYVAMTVEVEGEVERRDDILVFKIDLDTIKVF